MINSNYNFKYWKWNEDAYMHIAVNQSDDAEGNIHW